MKKGAKRSARKITPYTDLSDLRNLHQGEKCFICGAGPSFAFLDLTKIHSHIVLSINSSIIRLGWNTESDPLRRFWISNDTLCMRWNYFWQDVLRANCVKMVRTSWFQHDQKIKDHGFRYFTTRKTLRRPLPEFDGGLCFCSSVPTGLDLAILMGCSEIYLLGVDQKMVNGMSHFWQFYPKSKWPQRMDKRRHFSPEQAHQIRVFEKNKSAFESLNELAKSKSIKIWNCSKQSALKIFPFKSLDDATKS